MISQSGSEEASGKVAIDCNLEQMRSFLIKKRHHLNLEDFQNIITRCEDPGYGIPGSVLKPGELARFLGVSRGTIGSWLSRGYAGIPHVRIGTVVRFPKPWLCEWARKKIEILKKWNFEL